MFKGLFQKNSRIQSSNILRNRLHWKMKKALYTTCTFTCLIFNPTNAYEPELQSLLTYQEWQHLKDLPSCNQEIVILKDGTSRCGMVKSIPPIDYAFGQVNFKLSNVVAVAFGPNNKVQYITRDGQNFIGSLPKTNTPIVFIESQSEKPNEMDPQDVRLIVFRNHHLTNPPQSRLYSLQLKNGDHLPVYVESDSILFSNGWQEYSIDPDHIAEIKFNGGAYGYLARGDEVTKLNFSFVKDKYLAVHFPQNSESLKFRWDQIASLQKGTGGFIVHFLDEEEGQGMSKHVIGYLPNNILEKASGAVVIPPEIIANLDQTPVNASLSNDPDMEALFSKEGDFEEMQITFSEEPYEPPVLKKVEFNSLKIFTFEDFLERQPLEVKTLEVAVEDFEYKPLTEEDDEDANLPKEEIQFSRNSMDNPHVELIAEADEEEPIINSLENKNNGEEFKPGEEVQPSLKEESGHSSDEDNTFLQEEQPSPMIYVSMDTLSLGELTPYKESYAKKHQLQMALLPTQNAPTLIVRMPGFFIDLNLVSNKEYARFVNQTNYDPPKHWKEGKIPSGLENHPVVNISFQDALAYAIWKGKRLPTEMERARALDKNLIANDENKPFIEWTTSNINDRQMACPIQSCRAAILQLHQQFGLTSFRCAADATPKYGTKKL